MSRCLECDCELVTGCKCPQWGKADKHCDMCDPAEDCRCKECMKEQLSNQDKEIKDDLVRDEVDDTKQDREQLSKEEIK